MVTIIFTILTIKIATPASRNAEKLCVHGMTRHRIAYAIGNHYHDAQTSNSANSDGVARPPTKHFVV